MDEVSLVLEQFVDAFYNVAFAQHHLFPQGHELVLHVRLEAMNPVDALVEQALEEFLFDVSPVRKDLAIKHFCKNFPHFGVPVVDVGRRQTEGDDIARIVA